VGRARRCRVHPRLGHLPAEGWPLRNQLRERGESHRRTHLERDAAAGSLRHGVLVSEGKSELRAEHQGQEPPAPACVDPASLLVDGTTGLYGVTLGAGYIFGGSEVEGFVLGGLALDLSVGWTGYVIGQKVSDVFVTGGQLTAGEVLRQCRAGEIPAATCNRLRPAIKGAQDTLNQIRLALYGTQPLGETTDLDVGLSYDAYDQDPAIAGVFTSRAGVLLFQSSAASGLPLAPERLSARAGINQTLGLVELALWYQYTLYASDEGWQHAAGLKVRVKLGRDWRVWATGVAFFDALTTTTGSSASTVHASLVSGTVALGVRARF